MKFLFLFVWCQSFLQQCIALTLADIPLTFTSQLHNTDAIAGETVTLSAEMSKPGMEVTWLKNSMPLSLVDDTYHVVNEDNTYQLIIPNVEMNDGGEYTVKVGELQSTAQLTIFG